MARDAEPGGAPCTAPSSGGCAGDCSRCRARRRGWRAPSAKGGARSARSAASTALSKRALANSAARMLLGELPRQSCRARQRACGEQSAGIPGVPPPRSQSPGGHVLQHWQRSVTRRARSAKLPHAASRATRTEARAPHTPGARGWGAAQSPHSAPPSPSRCSPQSTSRLGPPRQFRDSVPIARASIPASAFRVLWVLGAGVCRHYRVQRRSPSSPGGIRGGLPAFQNLRPLASAPVLVCRR